MLGENISHYKVIEKLGEGGMGEVYKAEDTRLHRIVALKFLSSRALGTAEEKARFLNEALAAAALNHPNICTVYEINQVEDSPFIAMEYIEGQTLEEIIESGPIKLQEVRNIAMQIADGLQEAHGRQIVHRDIKPSNIMITGKGRVKIMDFGMAKSMSRTKLTMEGTTLGTVSYMSPEQGRGEDVDTRSDIWSLGVLIYEMVTGQLPFKGDFEQAVIYSILNEDPEPPTALRTGVPIELERITRKAMAKDPGNRYQHVDEFLVDLRNMRDDPASAHASGSPARKSVVSRLVGLAGAVVIIVAAIILARPYLFPGKDKVIDSIAVLPLDNLSGDPDQEYFADGMTEALIADLAKMPSIKVISRTSVMRYKDTRKTIPEIARELDVDAVIEGSVMKVGGNVRITAQLIEADSDRHLWAESYQRDMRDVLALQSDVARAIASEINIKLAPQAKDASSRVNRVDPEAYEAYLKGRYYWNRRTKHDLLKSIEYFEEAVRIDPDYARGYAAIAEAYVLMSDWGYYPAKSANVMVKKYAEKALSLDKESAAAYAALGLAAHGIDYDWDAAEEYYKKAILLNPNYATAHQWYGFLLSTSGRHDEAIDQARLAVMLDPMSPVINQLLGFIYYYARQYDEAIEQSRRTLELDEQFAYVYQIIYLSYLQKGMIPEAVGAFEKMLVESGSMTLVEEFDAAYKTSGYEGCVRWIIDNMDRWNYVTYLRPFIYAMAYAEIGEKDKSFDWLEEAYKVNSRMITTMGVEPALDSLRSDPRFDELLKKVGLS